MTRYVRSLNALLILFAASSAYAQSGTTLSGKNIDISSASQGLTTIPYGSNVNTTTSFALKGTSIHGNFRNFLQSNSMRCVSNAGRTPGIATGCVTNFSDMKASPGSLEAWARNASQEIDAGFVAAGGLHAHGDEINITNNDVDLGNADGDPSGFSSSTAQSVALGVTAIGHNVTGGVGLGSDSQRRFNRGFYAQAGTVTQCTLCDYNSGAIAVLDIRGAHKYGIDTAKQSGGPSIRLSAVGSLVARKGDDSGEYQVFSVNPSNQITLGFQSAGMFFATSLVPSADSALNIGSAALRIANVVSAANISDKYWVGTSSPVAGVSCPAGTVDIRTLVITNGIVTHC